MTVGNAVKVYTVQAFSDRPDGGNPAGVVLAADHLTEAKMQAIAAEVGYSETAFVLPSEKADFRLRFFTPSAEVDLCGHATIATFFTMLKLQVIQAGNYRQETLAGILDVSVSADGDIMMAQSPPVFLGAVDQEAIADSLNLALFDLDERFPVEIVSTGLADIIVPVRSLSILLGMQPDFEKVRLLSERYDTVGYHIFTLETLNPNNTAHCRNLAPRFGIPEESATGTANGALSAYLFKHQVISKSEANPLCYEQGDVMASPSLIRAALAVENAQIQTVWVGGSAYVTGERVL